MDQLELLDNQVNEADVKDLLRKQRSITSLFPKFYTRVKAVAAQGGVKLVKQGRDKDGKGVWVFKVHSGTKAEVWYEVTIRFMDLLNVLSRLVGDKKYWKTGGSGVDMRKIAPTAYQMVQLQTRCECPADLYWGKQYIRSKPKYDANVPPPEDRPPVVRNPHEYGAFCKHTQMAVNVLPLYNMTFAKFLGKFYGGTVIELEKSTRKAQAVSEPEEETGEEAMSGSEEQGKKGIRAPIAPVPPVPPIAPIAPKAPRAPIAPRQPVPPRERP
jgi:hypothetical protein